ncbi:SpoIIE family protein phosphatase [Nonomuraea sp. NPDC050153]|uniref:SpoIIE family protein phosphatase n=1 Tax=Nonomuraea sp. NPDC050153 TaxID=3364359 RepID=UPI00379D170E
MGTLDVLSPKPHRVPFGEGERILFFTDGVIEARNTAGRFYPLIDRVHVLRRENPQAALDTLRADLVDHVGGPLGDDATMLLLHRHTS